MAPGQLLVGRPIVRNGALGRAGCPACRHQAGYGRMPHDEPSERPLGDWLTTSGEPLSALAAPGPLLLVFLRHLGCTFSRQAVSDVLTLRRRGELEGIPVVFVHMGLPHEGKAFLAAQGWPDARHVSDPERHLYRAFGLRRAGAWRVALSPRVWWGGARSILLEGHRAGRPVGDPYQLPGAFLLAEGRIEAAFRHRTSADRPDYLRLVTRKKASDWDRNRTAPAEQDSGAPGKAP